MQSRVNGWWVFAAMLLGLSGTLNVIWGIAAIGNSDFFTANAHYVFSNLKTWGWITLIVGVIELFASASLFQGGGFGRLIGIVAASLAAIDALLSIPGFAILVDLRVRALDHHPVRARQGAGGQRRVSRREHSCDGGSTMLIA